MITPVEFNWIKSEKWLKRVFLSALVSERRRRNRMGEKNKNPKEGKKKKKKRSPANPKDQSVSPMDPSGFT
jgi:hypothetical protein